MAIPAALGMCCAGYDLRPLLAGDEVGLQESVGGSHDRPHILAVVLPRPARERSVTRNKLGNAATVGVNDRAGKRIGALINRVGNAIAVTVQRRTGSRLDFVGA